MMGLARGIKRLKIDSIQYHQARRHVKTRMICLARGIKRLKINTIQYHQARRHVKTRMICRRGGTAEAENLVKTDVPNPFLRPP